MYNVDYDSFGMSALRYTFGVIALVILLLFISAQLWHWRYAAGFLAAENKVAYTCALSPPGDSDHYRKELCMRAVSGRN